MRTIAIGILGFALASSGAAAQTAGERAQILRDFQVSVADYHTRHRDLEPFPEAVDAAAPAPEIFTLPVAMVFRQMIAKCLSAPDGVAAVGAPATRTVRGGVNVSGGSAHPHPAILEPFPSAWLQEFPRVLQDALPPLPTPLEYRLIGHDLVLRDTAADVVVGVLRDAVGPALTVKR